MARIQINGGVPLQGEVFLYKHTAVVAGCLDDIVTEVLGEELPHFLLKLQFFFGKLFFKFVNSYTFNFTHIIYIIKIW